MNASDLRSLITELGIGPTAFAQLVGVTPRAVSLWLAGEREVPGPAAAYLNLFLSLPKALQVKELARLTQEGVNMYEGMYGVEFHGLHGQGSAAIVLMDGKIFGCDTGGVCYDGSYQPGKLPQTVDARIRVEIPAGTIIVQTGLPIPTSYGFDLHVSFNSRGTTAVRVQTPLSPQPVEGRISFMRPLPN